MVKEYKCGYCGFVFQQDIQTFSSGSDTGRGDVSDALVCKQCGNFLKKEWSEAK